MIKQLRIGKTQRWILLRCYENMVKRGGDPKKAFCYKIDIYRDFYHLPCHTKGGDNVKAFFSEPQSVKVVSLSRSLHKMLQKNLIFNLKGFYGIVLTAAGISKAKELHAQENPTLPSF